MASYLKDTLRQALEKERKAGRAKRPSPARPEDLVQPPPGVDDAPDAPTQRAEQPTIPAGARTRLRLSNAVSPPKADASTSSKSAKVSLSADARDKGTLSDAAMAFERPQIVAPPPTRFQPIEPKNLTEAGLDEAVVEELILKYLLGQPGASGRQIASGVCLSPKAIKELLADMKQRKLVVFRSSTATGDFKYQLTEEGRDTAIDLQRQSRYVGAAPVPFEQYLVAIREQSIANEKPTIGDLYRAFQDLIVPENLLEQLGPAMTSGKGMFLFGVPGNGKTSLAERMTRAFGTSVYIPHSVVIEGTLIKVFDPMVHEVLDEDEDDRRPLTSKERIDSRWVKCRRPTVVAGGELTMDSLEIDFNPRTGICEAPLQMKANCGTLVIDDFGRQRMSPDVLLNRWIVPLEERVDYLRLPDGRKVRVPFDPLLVFSTNLEPKDLCDEAFLRRIPYKIEVDDPTESNFRTLLNIQAELLGFEPDNEVFDYLLDEHYSKVGRPFRNCHPRDLILQVMHMCNFRQEPLKMSKEYFDQAARNYFTLL